MKKAISTFLAAIFISHYLFSAAPLVHYYLADKYVNTCTNYTKEQKESFFRGTEFPDIRYMANVPREQTHDVVKDLSEIKSETNPFIAGKKFHSFVDDFRAKIVDKNILVGGKLYDFSQLAIKKYDTSSERIQSLLKLIEDEILFDKLKSTSTEIFNKVESDALKFGVSEDLVKRWYASIKRSFDKLPSTTLAQLSEAKKPFMDLSPSLIAAWSKNLAEHAKEKEIEDYFNSMIAEFESEFAKFKNNFKG